MRRAPSDHHNGFYIPRADMEIKKLKGGNPTMKHARRPMKTLLSLLLAAAMLIPATVFAYIPMIIFIA